MPWGSDLASLKLGGKARAESLHFFSTEPLFLIRFGALVSGRGSQEVRPARSRRTFFRRNHFPSFASGSGQRRGSQEVRPARSSRRHFFSTGTTFPHSPGSNQRLPEAKGSGLPESKRTLLFAEPFLILFNSPETLGPHPRFLPQRVR